MNCSTHNSSLGEVCCHDDDISVIVPHHSPEVFNSCLHWSLRRYVLPRSPLVTLPFTSLIKVPSNDWLTLM